MPKWVFANDNDHLTCLTQGAAQDFFWINEVVEALRMTKMAGYFVPKGQESSFQAARVFYAVIPRSEDFVIRYKDFWNRLTDQGLLKLRLYENWNEDIDAEPMLFRARILAHKDGVSELKGHVSSDHPHDLVLSVQVEYSEMVKVFAGRGAAEAERIVCWMPLDNPLHSADMEYRRTRRIRVVSHWSSTPACRKPRERSGGRSVSRPMPNLSHLSRMRIRVQGIKPPSSA
jgi:hypothetical protein